LSAVSAVTIHSSAVVSDKGFTLKKDGFD